MVVLRCLLGCQIFRLNLVASLTEVLPTCTDVGVPVCEWVWASSSACVVSHDLCLDWVTMWPCTYVLCCHVPAAHCNLMLVMFPPYTCTYINIHTHIYTVHSECTCDIFATCLKCKLNFAVTLKQHAQDTSATVNWSTTCCTCHLATNFCGYKLSSWLGAKTTA